MCFATRPHFTYFFMEIKDIVLVVCDVQMCFLSSYILLYILCCDSCHANKPIVSYLILIRLHLKVQGQICQSTVLQSAQ